MSATFAPPSAYLSAREAARRLGVSDKTVRSWVRNGRLPGAESARGFRIPADRVDTLAADRSADQGADSRDQSATFAESAHLRDLVAHLESHVADLRTQLDARTREVGELHIILRQTQLALPTSQMRPISRDSDGSTLEPTQTPSETPRVRPWWRFWRT